MKSNFKKQLLNSLNNITDENLLYQIKGYIDSILENKINNYEELNPDELKELKKDYLKAMKDYKEGKYKQLV